MNTINDRIRALREELGLSQTAFGEPIGLSRDEVKNIEYKKTAPKEITIPLICKEYSVSEAWLRDGIGEPYLKREDDDDLKVIFDEIGVSDNEVIKAIIRAYWKLPDNAKAAVRQFSVDAAAQIKKSGDSSPASK